jgi:hypothetical protein
MSETLTIVNAVATFALVMITAWYARLTSKILSQSQEQTVAMREQAVATKEAVSLSRQTAQDQRQIGRSIIASTVQTALRNIEYYRALEIEELSADYSLPERAFLVPEGGSHAVQQAKLWTSDASVELASALDTLRHAEGQYQIIHRRSLRGHRASEDDMRAFLGFLKSADESLRVALSALREPNPAIR